jgi:PAS domain-containing protein
LTRSVALSNFAGVTTTAAALTAPPSQAPLDAVISLVAERPEQLAEILEASASALIAFDMNRRILHANTAAESLFRHDRGALDGKSTDILIPERLRQPDARRHARRSPGPSA